MSHAFCFQPWLMASSAWFTSCWHLGELKWHISLIICRSGGALPVGVHMSGEKLVFDRALQANDSGIYECTVKNPLGEGKAEFTVEVIGGENLFFVCLLNKNKKKTGTKSTSLLLCLQAINRGRIFDWLWFCCPLVENLKHEPGWMMQRCKICPVSKIFQDPRKTFPWNF